MLPIYFLYFQRMFLENIDVFSDEEESCTKSSEDENSRQIYVPKMCSSELDFRADFNGAKSRADLYFYEGQYTRAKVLYEELHVSKETIL